jgi:methylenetetrahydrofolate dehydrogenase (NADP+)/methenyltetrahydrofolate cyclohydrolase
MLLDGKQLSKKIKKELKDEVSSLSIKPTLAIILVGNNPASEIYVKNKLKSAKYCGINTSLIIFEETITQEKLISEIHNLNNNEIYHGIIVQLPLPHHIDEQAIINAIDPKKDVDGFGILNKGKLFSGLNSIESATPKGIMRLLEEYNIEIKGKHAVVVGRSNIVGKPMAIMLLNKHATVTICHSKTENLKEITKQADILVVAIGKAKFITKDMVKEGAVVIDVGTNRVNDLLVGDVDFENVEPIASYITPVPGGTGPLTIASLLENTVIAYKSYRI